MNLAEALFQDVSHLSFVTSIYHGRSDQQHPRAGFGLLMLCSQCNLRPCNVLPDRGPGRDTLGGMAARQKLEGAWVQSSCCAPGGGHKGKLVPLLQRVES